MAVPARIKRASVSANAGTAQRTDAAEAERDAFWGEYLIGDPAILLLIDPATGAILEASETAADFYGYSRDDLRSMTMDQINVLPFREVADKIASAPAGVGTPRLFRLRHRLASGEVREVDAYVGPLTYRGRRAVQAVIYDVTELSLIHDERDRLSAAVDQLSESVLIADPAANIIYVNPAFERATGYTRDEIIGQNPAVLKSGLHSPAFYTAMWAMLKAGRIWHGELINRRKDGTLITEETSITPVLDPSSALRFYVAVKRDVTAARWLEARLDKATLERSSISAMLTDLIPGDTAEATAEAIADRILTMPDVVFVTFAQFIAGDEVRVLSARAIDGSLVPADIAGHSTATARRRIRLLRAIAGSGPTIETWTPAIATPFASEYQRLGVTAIAMLQLRADGETVGLLGVGAAGESGRSALELAAPTLTAFATVASLLLGPQLGQRKLLETHREAIRAVIDNHRFRPVFQPIVALPGGLVVGYEALTRFSDGSDPESRFAEALAVGLGVDLEAATLDAAVTAAAVLPEVAWLDLNVSPALLEDPARLAAIIGKAESRSIVLEITEHEAIADYAHLRQSVAAIGIPVRLAVDDAGAGFASMRHIVELRPDIIKLDRSLIADIDSDLVRQGLVAGLRHFASTAGASLVAEGVETYPERATLMALGVEYGQGYLLGRPGSAARVRRHVFKPLERRAAVIRPHDAASRRDVVHRVNAIVWEADATDERMTFVSDAAFVLTGHSTDRWRTEPGFWERHVHPDDREASLASIAEALSSGSALSLEYRFRMADGRYRWFEDLIEVLPDDGHVRLVGVMVDVTDRRALEQELARQATHDPLTDLLNRTGLEEYVARAMPVARSRTAAILFFDLDAFKDINDSLGHRAGDDLLRVVASRLRASVRGTDAVARFGGDEFVVFATAESPAALVELGDRLLTVVRAPSEIAGRTMSHPVSGGIAFVTDDADTALRDADIAMYVAKRAGGDRLIAYEPRMRVAPVGRPASRPSRAARARSA